VITVPEMAMAAQVVLGVSFSPVETYTVVAVLYWALTAAVAAGMLLLERRYAPLIRGGKSRSDFIPASSPAAQGNHHG
jgi:ABC-type arginine/histidine transport system permease subunit